MSNTLKTGGRSGALRILAALAFAVVIAMLATTSIAFAADNVLADTTQGSSSSSAASQPAGQPSSQVPTASSSAAPAAGQASQTSGGTAASANLAMSLVFDVSGSMGDTSGLNGATKLDAAKKQSIDFVNSVHKTGTDANGGVPVQIGVASFSSNGKSECELSTDSDQVSAAISGLRAWGQTNMYDGIDQGLQQLSKASGEKMIVLLSDGYNNQGHSNDEVIALANQAASQGVKIYAIGFGPTGDLDEDLLRQIASITGGTYAHEDSSTLSSAAVGLFGTMMEAQLSATGRVLLSQTGTVAQGATASLGTFTVDEAGTLKAYLYWPGSDLKMVLHDPDGVEVTEGYPGSSIDASTIPATITITAVKRGTWDVSVFGKEVSMANEPFYAATALVAGTGRAVGGGGGSGDGSGWLFLVGVLAVACIGGVYAFSVRRGKTPENS